MDAGPQLRSLYNEDRNLLRVREKERRNQEAHQEEEEFPEEMPLFGEPYKTAKGDELSSRLQNMLGNYEEMKEFLSITSCSQCPDATDNRLGKPRYPLLPERGSGIPSSPFQTGIHHPPLHNTFPRPLPVDSSSHHSKMVQSRKGPMPGSRAKGCGPPDTQHLTQDRLAQEGSTSSQHKRGDRRADRDPGAPGTGAAPASDLSPFLSSLPSPVLPLSPVHSSQPAPPKTQGGSKVQGAGSSGKGCCPTRSPKDPVMKAHDKEVAPDSMTAVTSHGVGPQPPPQTFPPPPLPSKSGALQQKPTAYVRPMDGQDQAPSESPELKLQSFERGDSKAPPEARLTKLKMPPLPVEQTYSSDIHCVEEILKEMTHSWPPPLTAIHTPSTAEPSKFPFPTKDSQHISSATQNQKQHDAPPKTQPRSQQGTSMLEDDLQLSDSEDSDSEQTPEKPPSSAAPPSAAPLSLPEPVASAHSSSAESESTSDSDSSSDSESESSSSDSEENEPRDAPTAEPEPPPTNKWQLDNWLSKVGQPATAPEGLGGAESARCRAQQGQDDSDLSATRATGPTPVEPKAPPLKSCSRVPRGPAEAPHASRRGSHKSPVQQELPPRQTVGTKHPKRPTKASAPATATDTRASSQRDREPAHVLCNPKDPTCKDKPRVKTKGRPRAGGNREPGPTPPAPGEKEQPVSCASVPADSSAQAPSPEPFAPVPLAQVQAPAQGSGRTSGCRQAMVIQEDSHKDTPLPLRHTRVLSPVRDMPVPHSLVVKIALNLIARVPQLPGKGGRPKKPEEKLPSAGKRQELEKRSSDSPVKGARKRKGEAERDCDSKKTRLEKEVKSQPSLSSSSHKESSKTKTRKPSSEPSKKEMLPPPPVSSSSTSSSQKPAKYTHKRSRREADLCQDPPQSASAPKSSHRDPSVPKHRKAQGKGSAEHRGSSDTANPFPVPSLPNGTSKPGKPHVKGNKQQADFHMKEAKKLKCKAESMTDKVGKAFKYLDAPGVTQSHPATVFPHVVNRIVHLWCRVQKLRVPVHVLSTGAPSPLSPVPSPASSAGAPPSAGGLGSSGVTATVSTPVTIQNMTSSYVTITSHVLTAFDLWEQAEALAKKSKEFFAQLSTKTCTLALNSSLADLVHYARQGFQWLKQATKTP
ncbi:AF4/FMR2 family member 1 [Octodon degus]|uniref:AF4/FMR2 family member 1 n=1 Tax=Octodon degus TaxID=10160 RepID=A0A6P6E9I9_OCTDE|nr:AF4/FMR2 family member 1 [Octodon degus]